MVAVETVARQQCGRDTAWLVEAANDIERAIRDDEGPYRFDWRDKKHRVTLDAVAKLREAASLIQSQAARIVELEAGIRKIAAWVKPLSDDTPAEDKRDKRHAHSLAVALLNKEGRG